jgi:hypothetical protein
MLYMLLKGNTTEWLVEGMTTLQASHCNGSTTAPCGQMAKNQTDWQLEWLLHSNHMTIQLQRCS